MISDKEIEAAKHRTQYFLKGSEQSHEHPDCIRIAYEWFDAQQKIKKPNKKKFPFILKHYVEAWSGRYISSSDVCVAAELHPEIHGKYPFFNISSRLVEPSLERLANIGEAMTQENYRKSHRREEYKTQEYSPGNDVEVLCHH